MPSQISKVSKVPLANSQSAEVKYVVESPRREDEGRYTCVATSIAGSASSSIFLDMKGDFL